MNLSDEEWNAIHANNHAEALAAQRNEHANKEAHWFAMYMAAQELIKQLESKVKELSQKKAKK